MAFLLDDDFVRRAVRSIKLTEQRALQAIGRSRLRADQEDDLYFITNAALTAAADPFAGATSVEVTVMVPDYSTATTPISMKLSTRVETVVNRSIDTTADEDTFGVARYSNGEYLVFWMDCSATTRPA